MGEEEEEGGDEDEDEDDAVSHGALTEESPEDKK